MIEKVPLGRTGLKLSRVGFGTSAIGGLYTAMTDEAAAKTLGAAWTEGTRYFDTAPHYGAGLAEQRLGSFLAGKSDFVVSTKVGRLLRPGPTVDGDEGFYGAPPMVRVRDYSADGVYRSLAESLDRTGLDSFDILLIHDPDDYWEQAVGEAYPALARLRAEGAVKAIGVGMNQSAMLARFVAETDVDCVLIAGRYTLLDRDAELQLLPLCVERGVGVIVGGVYNSGILARPDSNATFDYAPAPPAVQRRVTELAATCAAYGVPLATAALRFPLRHKAVTSVLVGARTPAEIAENSAALAMDIPEELWAQL
ncbi:aldo/keto reductase [Amycolatopsis taiwanensis]|uniref:Oxidoreductase n=1 Tax=Amycolatopsis taiwanensis TaxID=342230 RepID=A0A9W6VEE4_9PSEU|nr:aldo/keto reductase [Amycolatopsis taiwanensis]GLY63411.1 oxidoreductase [Amycolatopsis taiwanensis]